MAFREDPVAAISDVVCAHPRHRELYYQCLAYCQEERTLDEAEDYLESLPEYKGALQNSTTLTNVLLKCGGLEYREYDADGRILDEDYLEELAAQDATDDDIYELVARRTLTTTEAGKAVVDIMGPQKRIARVVSIVPERESIFQQVLNFCSEPRSLDDINNLISNDPLLDPSERTANIRLRPSYFIDKLHEAGALVWEGVWCTTDAGREWLAQN